MKKTKPFNLGLCLLFLASLAYANPPAHNKVHLNGIDIYYELHNKGGKNPLVLIAGFSCDHTFWDGIINQLAKDHEVLVFDNRGIGQTDAPDSLYTIDMMADDTMALINHLGIKNPTIIGQSMGSAIAQTMGKKYGDKINKLVLINTFPYLAKAPEMAFEFTGQLHKANAPLKEQVKSIAPWVFSSEFLSQPNQLDNLINLATANPYPQSLIGYERQLGALKGFNSLKWLKKIKAPTLIIVGEEDIIALPKEANEVAKGIGEHAKLVVIPGGHASPVEQPEKVSQVILDFLD